MVTTLVFADQHAARRAQIARKYSAGFSVRECASAAGLRKLLCCNRPSVVVIGSMPAGPAEAIEAANQVHCDHPAARVIYLADDSSEAIAIGALRAGVTEYLRPPISPLDVAKAIDRLLPAAGDSADDCGEMIGNSEVMRELKDLVRRIAPMDSTVLITGETGAGKEVMAQLIHRLSTRARAPLVCVNCAAIPETLLESDLFGHESGAFTGAFRRQPGQIQLAHGGTLFLDEIGDMSLVAQSKLLRVIEKREVRPLGTSTAHRVDIRLIAATHCKLEQRVAAEKFRGDLFYRINVVRIHIPPLRERIDDVPALAGRFLAELGERNGRRIDGFTPGAMQRLMDYDWPGNVRELRNVIETAMVVCRSDEITDDDLRGLQRTFSGLPMERTASSMLPILPPGPEIDRLMQALRATNWNVTKTARMLHWSRMTVYRKVAKYGVERPAGVDDLGQDAAGDESREQFAKCNECV